MHSFETSTAVEIHTRVKLPILSDQSASICSDVEDEAWVNDSEAAEEV